jgi:hypothetical protein
MVAGIIKTGKSPLCSTSQDGYYFPENDNEFYHSQNEDLKRIRELARRHRNRRLSWIEHKRFKAENVKAEQLSLV